MPVCRSVSPRGRSWRSRAHCARPRREAAFAIPAAKPRLGPAAGFFDLADDARHCLAVARIRDTLAMAGMAVVFNCRNDNDSFVFRAAGNPKGLLQGPG